MLLKRTVMLFFYHHCCIVCHSIYTNKEISRYHSISRKQSGTALQYAAAPKDMLHEEVLRID